MNIGATQKVQVIEPLEEPVPRLVFLPDPVKVTEDEPITVEEQEWFPVSLR